MAFLIPIFESLGKKPDKIMGELHKLVLNHAYFDTYNPITFNIAEYSVESNTGERLKLILSFNRNVYTKTFEFFARFNWISKHDVPQELISKGFKSEKGIYIYRLRDVLTHKSTEMEYKRFKDNLVKDLNELQSYMKSKPEVERKTLTDINSDEWEVTPQVQKEKPTPSIQKEPTVNDTTDNEDYMSLMDRMKELYG